MRGAATFRSRGNLRRVKPVSPLNDSDHGDEIADLEAVGLEAEVPDVTDVFSLSRSEVRRRSLAGIFYLTSSSVANLLIGFFSSLVLARLLTPSDFGVVAIGSTVSAARRSAGGRRARRRHGRTAGAPHARRATDAQRNPAHTGTRGLHSCCGRRARVRSYWGSHGDHDRLASDHDASDAWTYHALEVDEVRPSAGCRSRRSGELPDLLRGRRRPRRGCLGAGHRSGRQGRRRRRS